MRCPAIQLQQQPGAAELEDKADHRITEEMQPLAAIARSKQRQREKRQQNYRHGRIGDDRGHPGKARQDCGHNTVLGLWSLQGRMPNKANADSIPNIPIVL